MHGCEDVSFLLLSIKESPSAEDPLGAYGLSFLAQDRLGMLTVSYKSRISLVKPRAKARGLLSRCLGHVYPKTSYTRLLNK